MKRLPFTHGIEMELQVLKNNGEWIKGGGAMESVFNKIIEAAQRLLISAVKNSKYDYIKKQSKKIYIKEVNEKDHIRGKVLFVDYLLDGKILNTELLGRDPHGVGITWILEAVTPPCAYLEELQWWLSTLYKICNQTVKDIAGITLISSGLNPIKEYSTGISFGDHHHIGIPDKKLRIQIYNIFRNYLPYLIALSVNSPFENGANPGIKTTRTGCITSAEHFSKRILHNKAHLSSEDPVTFIPYLTEYNPDFFTNKTQKADAKSARLSDIYPFTRFGTIEIRVFDAQLSIIDRMGMALLIQALALKAKNIYEEGGSIPSVSDEILTQNRTRAYKKGLMLGIKKDSKISNNNPEFSSIYQDNYQPSGKKIKYMNEACGNVFFYLLKELRELDVLETPYLNSFLISTFGGTKDKINPPLSPAQYQLYLFQNIANNNFNTESLKSPSLINILGNIAEKSANNFYFNPIVETFGEPKLPKEFSAPPFNIEVVTPDEIYAGDKAHIRYIILKSTFGKENNLSLSVRVYDEKDNVSFHERFDIPKITHKEPFENEIIIKTEENISNYNIFFKLCKAKKTLKKYSENLSVNRIVTIIDHLGTDAYVGENKILIPLSFQIENYSKTKRSVDISVKLIEINTKESITISEHKIELQPFTKRLFGPEMTEEIVNQFRRAEAILTGQDYVHIPLFKVKKKGANIHSQYRCKMLVESQSKLLSECSTDVFSVFWSKKKKIKVQLNKGNRYSKRTYYGLGKFPLSLNAKLMGAEEGNIEIYMKIGKQRRKILTSILKKGTNVLNESLELPNIIKENDDEKAYLIIVDGVENKELTSIEFKYEPITEVAVNKPKIHRNQNGVVEVEFNLFSDVRLENCRILIDMNLSRKVSPTIGKKKIVSKRFMLDNENCNQMIELPKITFLNGAIIPMKVYLNSGSKCHYRSEYKIHYDNDQLSILNMDEDYKPEINNNMENDENFVLNIDALPKKSDFPSDINIDEKEGDNAKIIVQTSTEASGLSSKVTNGKPDTESINLVPEIKQDDKLNISFEVDFKPDTDKAVLANNKGEMVLERISEILNRYPKRHEDDLISDANVKTKPLPESIERLKRKFIELESDTGDKIVSNININAISYPLIDDDGRLLKKDLEQNDFQQKININVEQNRHLHGIYYLRLLREHEKDKETHSITIQPSRHLIITSRNDNRRISKEFTLQYPKEITPSEYRFRIHLFDKKDNTISEIFMSLHLK